MQTPFGDCLRRMKSILGSAAASMPRPTMVKKQVEYDATIRAESRRAAHPTDSRRNANGRPINWAAAAQKKTLTTTTTTTNLHEGEA
jgi:hypothetical protein